MKWIGQHIWDFISRFRSDVYLEGTETGTIASGGNLGLDSNNKIVKADTEAGELTIANATDDRVVTSTGGTGLNAESDFTFNSAASLAAMSWSSGGNLPELRLSNTNSGASGALIRFQKTDNGSADDTLGNIAFDGNDDGGGTQVYAQMLGKIVDPGAGSERGKLEFKVAENDGNLTSGLTIAGGDTDDTINTTIGGGINSLTTIAGDLNFSSASVNILASSYLDIQSNGNMGFSIDTDNDSTTNDFFWCTDGSSHAIRKLMNLSDEALLTVGGQGGTAGNVTVVNLVDDANGPILTLHSQRGVTATDGQDGDVLGEIQFTGYDDGTPTDTKYAKIEAQIADASNTDEAGTITLTTATESVLRNAFKATGSGASSKVDVSIGYSVGSRTSVAGNILMEGDTLTLGGDNDNITTIEKFPHSDGAGGRLYIHGANATDGQTDNAGGHLMFFTGRSTGTGNMGTFGFYAGREAASTGTGLNSSELISKLESIGSGTSGTTDQYWYEGGGIGTNDYFKLSVAQHGATTLSTVAQSGNEGDLTLDAHGEIVLDAHTGEDIFFKENGTERIQWHLDSTPTMEVTGNFDINSSGDIALNATGNDINVDTDNFTITSAIGYNPNLNVTCTDTTSTKCARINLIKDGVDTEDDEALGEVNFKGEDEGDNLTTFGSISGHIVESDEGDEAGKITIQVANDGVLRDGISVIANKAVAQEVNVAIGGGEGSVTTIRGDLDIDGDNVTTAGALTITPSGAFSVAGGSSEIDLTTSGTVDVNAGTVSITGVSCELVGKTQINRRQFATPSDGAGNADGDVIYIGTNDGGGGGAATTAGKVYYYHSNGSWVATNSDDPSTATGLLAVALGTDPDQHGMLLRLSLIHI